MVYSNIQWPVTQKGGELAGCSHYLKASVETNCFFFDTTNESQLYPLLSNVKHLGVYSES